MTSRRISGKGDVSVSESETGLYQFGQAMIIRAAPAFQKNGIVVEHASVVPPGEWQPAARKAFAEFGAGRLKGATVVVVTPRSGKARATPNAATVSMTFEVRVVDADSAKVIWDGMVDTSTWNGRDFLTKNVQANKYDEAYADQFLDIIITTLRSNGFL